MPGERRTLARVSPRRNRLLLWLGGTAKLEEVMNFSREKTIIQSGWQMFGCTLFIGHVQFFGVWRMVGDWGFWMMKWDLRLKTDDLPQLTEDGGERMASDKVGVQIAKPGLWSTVEPS